MFTFIEMGPYLLHQKRELFRGRSRKKGGGGSRVNNEENAFKKCTALKIAKKALGGGGLDPLDPLLPPSVSPCCSFCQRGSTRILLRHILGNSV